MDDIQNLTTEWLAIPVRDGDDASVMRAYLARPAGTGCWPAVLVGFEMFGLTGFARSIADRLAQAGYLTLVPDFFHWQCADGEHVELES